MQSSLRSGFLPGHPGYRTGQSQLRSPVWPVKHWTDRSAAIALSRCCDRSAIAGCWGTRAQPAVLRRERVSW